jgi:hypothetical protein
MLKTKKNFALTAAALAVGYAGSAMAQIDFSAGDDAVPYANEFDTTSTVTPPGFEADSPIAINSETLRYARVDLSSGSFNSAPTLNMSGVTVAPEVLLVEGGASASHAIFSIETGTATSAQVSFDDVLTFATATTINVDDNSTTVSVTIGLYETQAAASNSTDLLGSTVTGDYFTWGSSISSGFTQTGATAEVTTDFIAFSASSGTTASVTLGSISVGVNSAINPNTNATVSMSDLASAITVDVAGDYTGWFDEDGSASGGVVYLAGNTATSVSLTNAVFSYTGTDISGSFWFQASGSGQISESDYDATVSFNSTASATLSNITGSFGSITRNGTNVDIPYITTFDGYNQRLVMVNRSTQDAAYTVTFTPEGAVGTPASPVTATALAKATGTVPANETLIIKMTEVVTLTGGTRTAGHVSIVAEPSAIDVATTQVTLADQSTDTVVLQ